MPDQPADFTKLLPPKERVAAIYENYYQRQPFRTSDGEMSEQGLGELYHRLRQDFTKATDPEQALKAKTDAQQVMEVYAQKWKHLTDRDVESPEAQEISLKVANSLNASEKITDVTDPRYVDPKHIQSMALNGHYKHPLEAKMKALLAPYLSAIPMTPPRYR